MRRILIESPFNGETLTEQATNLAYLRVAMRDSFDRGEAPFASHAMYPFFGLDDKVPNERQLGIKAGLIWGEAADATAVYVDRGISPGMEQGIERAKELNRIIEYRTIKGWKAFEEGRMEARAGGTTPAIDEKSQS